MQDYLAQAKKVMEGFCRVCPECDGKACAGQVPGMGGAGSGASFRANVQALCALKLNMRLIHDIADPDTALDFFGYRLDLPVLAAPVAGVSFNLSRQAVEEEYMLSLLAGCRQAGTMGCTGDGVPDNVYQAGFSAIARLEGHGIPFIKPWEDKELLDKLKKAADTGARLAGLDIDSVGLITVRLMGRAITARTADKLADIAARTPLKIILKGIMHPRDAELAIEAGAAGIVVSNHGGRLTDHTPATAQVLPLVAQAVAGRIPVLADGGVRSGGDVLKMLALGADAVMIGRPVAIAALGGGEAGVMAYLQRIKTELIQAMILTGTACVTRVEKDVLFA